MQRFALHRRVLMDRARTYLIQRYGLSHEDLFVPRLATCSPSEHARRLADAKAKVRPRLAAEDAELLPDAALDMILDRDHAVVTIRGEGDEAAHDAGMA